MPKIRIDTSGLSRKLNSIPRIIKLEIEKTFFRLVKKAEEAMDKRIQDYDQGQTPSGIKELFNKPNYTHMKPRSGQLRDAVHTAIESPTVKQVGFKYSRDLFNIDQLDQMTDWNGSLNSDKRPIQSAKHWKNNPYPESGYWKVYNDGFNWGDVRIYGRNFIGAAHKRIDQNMSRELQNMKSRIYYHINRI